MNSSIIECLEREVDDKKFLDLPIESDWFKIKVLMTHCSDPLIRSFVRPMGELYAPVYWDGDLLVKLSYKPRWGGFCVFATSYEMAIFDIDLPKVKPGSTPSHIEYIEQIKADIYQSGLDNELFYVHQTERGFHLYLVSRKLDYCVRETLEMGIKLRADPAHLRNTLYYGFSVRCNLKEGDSYVSKRIGTIGNGIVNSDMLKIYQRLTKIQRLFDQCDCKNILNSTNLLDLRTLAYQNNGSSGNLHIEKVAPLWFREREPKDNGSCNFASNTVERTLPNIEIINLLAEEKNEVYEKLWRRACKRRFFRESDFLTLIKVVGLKIRKMVQYHVLSSNDDYAIGYDVGQSLIFICFRNLACLDYDDPNRLKIVYEFTRYHPEYLFKVVQTNKGYHVFCLSHPMDHSQLETVKFLSRLASDPFHILNAYIRGYSIRVNRKLDEAKPYKEVRTIGRGRINKKLERLYQLHFQLYEKYDDAFRCQVVTKFTHDMLRERAGIQENPS